MMAINSGMMELLRELSERERGSARVCTCMHVCVCAHGLFLFHFGCEKNSDQMTKIVLCSQKSNGLWQLFSERREKFSLKYQHHLLFPPVLLSSLEVPLLYFRTGLWIITDFSVNLYKQGKSVLHHKASSNSQNHDEGEALMLCFALLCFIGFFYSLPSAALIYYLTL